MKITTIPKETVMTLMFVVAMFGSSSLSSTKRFMVTAFNGLASSSTLRFTPKQNVMPSNKQRFCSARLLATVAPSSSSSDSFSVSSDTIPPNEETTTTSSSTSIYVLESESLSKLKSTFLQTMRDRGFLHQCTGIVALDEKLCSGTQAVYLGFDATADSLHVGSLLQIMILRHLQKAGHKPVVLVGGGTSKVGDPTGKDESRILLTDEIILQNIAGISKVFDKFLTFGNENPTDAIIVNNNDWLNEIKYLDFLRQYGTQFTINRMLSFESVKQRLNREAPFSFLEFNYMILQAYDFLELNRRYKCVLQLGGSDQWGNMVAGTELGRKVDGVQLFALTAPLITTSDGKKMGKTANGAVWLNKDKLSEYDYWQFWRNTADEDVIRFLKLFTELPLDEINELEKLEGSAINEAKIILANEATKLLHGEECLPAIQETISNMFSGSGTSTEGLPRTVIKRSDLVADGVRILDLFVELKLASSKKEARRLIQGGGARLEIVGDGSATGEGNDDDEEKIDDENYSLTIDSFRNGSTEIILRAGKKRAGVVELTE